ncbi:MAG: hypothetical protein WA733_02255 [Methylocystis sp.]
MRGALDESPHGKDAYKRPAAPLHRRDEPDETLRLADRLSSRGVGHSRLLASRTLALAKLGLVEEARAFDNLHRQMLEPPGGLRKPRRVQ